MLIELKKGDTDIVLGSRFLGRKAENMPRAKRLLLRLAVLFSNVTSGLKLTDTHNGLRAFNRKTANLLNLKMSNYAHASEILYRVSSHKLAYKEHPTSVTYSEYSKQKGQPMINAVNVVVDSLLNKFN